MCRLGAANVSASGRGRHVEHQLAFTVVLLLLVAACSSTGSEEGGDVAVASSALADLGELVEDEDEPESSDDVTVAMTAELSGGDTPQARTLESGSLTAEVAGDTVTMTMRQTMYHYMRGGPDRDTRWCGIRVESHLSGSGVTGDPTIVEFVVESSEAEYEGDCLKNDGSLFLTDSITLEVGAELLDFRGRVDADGLDGTISNLQNVVSVEP